MRKEKRGRRPVASRWAIPAIVALAVVAVLVAKTVDGSRAAAVSAAAATATPAAPEAMGIVAQVAGDLYPTLPAEQIAWVQRHGKSAMVLFHSMTCIPCKEMERLVAKVRAEYEQDIVFIDVILDDSANRPLAAQMGIRYKPTSFFIDSHGQATQQVGAVSEEALCALLDDLRAGS